MLDSCRQISELRKLRPCLPAAEIARQVGISRERVRQILSKLGLPTDTRVSRLCIVCSKRLNGKANYKYCSKDCQYQDSHILVRCDNCGNLKQVGKSHIITQTKRYQHFFCSKYCRSQWAGNHYGFGIHKKHGSGSPRKWDWELVWNTHIETGFGCNRLSRLLNIPLGTISYILRMCRKTLKGK